MDLEIGPTLPSGFSSAFENLTKTSTTKQKKKGLDAKNAVRPPSLKPDDPHEDRPGLNDGR